MFIKKLVFLKFSFVLLFSICLIRCENLSFKVDSFDDCLDDSLNTLINIENHDILVNDNIEQDCLVQSSVAKESILEASLVRDNFEQDNLGQDRLVSESELESEDEVLSLDLKIFNSKASDGLDGEKNNKSKSGYDYGLLDRVDVENVEIEDKQESK